MAGCWILTMGARFIGVPRGGSPGGGLGEPPEITYRVGGWDTN